VTSFETAELILDNVRDSSLAFKDSGIITLDQYAKVGAIHKPARDALIKARDTYKLYLKATDAVKKGQLWDNYTALLAEFSTLLNNLLELALKWGVISQGENATYRELLKK
jgi:hypothetical protein